MHRIVTAFFCYFVCNFAFAELLQCSAFKGDGKGWLPEDFTIDLSSDRKTANVLQPRTDYFGNIPFEQGFLGGSLWARGKGRTSGGQFRNYQLQLDFYNGVREIRITRQAQGFYDIVLR